MIGSVSLTDSNLLSISEQEVYWYKAPITKTMMGAEKAEYPPIHLVEVYQVRISLYELYIILS